MYSNDRFSHYEPPIPTLQPTNEDELSHEDSKLERAIQEQDKNRRQFEHVHVTGSRWLYEFGDRCIHRLYEVSEYVWDVKHEGLRSARKFELSATAVKDVIGATPRIFGPKKLWLFIPDHLMKIFKLTIDDSPLDKFLTNRHFFFPFSWMALSYPFNDQISLKEQVLRMPARFSMSSSLICPACEHLRRLEEIRAD